MEIYEGLNNDEKLRLFVRKMGSYCIVKKLATIKIVLLLLSIIGFVLTVRLVLLRPNTVGEPTETLIQRIEDIVKRNANVSMDDPALVQEVTKLLRPPSLAPTKFNALSYGAEGVNPSAGQVQLVEEILKGFGHDGFFIECGANDGEWYSNTIWLERTLGWKGLLIEADPEAYQKLLTKNRNAWSGHFCLSASKVPKTLPFYQNGGVMGSLIHMAKFHRPKPVTVQCVPLYTVLLAINRTTVDYFSLDIEGSELDVLRTVPLDKVIFKVISVEFIFIKEGKEALKDFMLSHGYNFYKSFEHPGGLAGDFIFIHSSVNVNGSSVA